MGKITNNVQEITKHMGEKLVMFQLMKYKKWDVDYVNYVGADLIAIDKEKNQKYAISVKTKNHETDGHSCSLFKDNDAQNLREFAADMSSENDVMIPIVTYVIVKLDGTVCSFFINLDDLDDMRNDKSNEIIKSGEKGYLFVYGNQSNPNKLKTEKGKKKNIEYDAELFKKVLIEERISHIITPLSNVKMNTLYKNWNWESFCLEKEMNNSQQGDFGENYIMWRARDYGMRAFGVKSVGADIILQDKANKTIKYAVSVKTFTKKENGGYEFERDNILNLKAYTNKWNLTGAIVSFLFVVNKDDGKTIYNINMKLDYLEKNAMDPNVKWAIVCEGETNQGGYRVKWNKKTLDAFKKDKNIVMTKIQIE